MHQTIDEQGAWLQRVVTGFNAYHAIPTNAAALGDFRFNVTNIWRRTLNWRGQKGKVTWRAYDRAAKSMASQAGYHASMAETCASPSNTQGGSPVREFRSHGSGAGCALKAHETMSPGMATAVKPSRQPRTESCVVSGNGPCEA